MPIVKQSFPINFSQGLDTKTDPKQVQIGKFLSLENSIFDKGGLLQKRNGFKSLTAIASDTCSYLTTFNGNLTAIGSKINALNANSNEWVSKGSYQSLDLTTLPLVRNNLNQSQCDTVISNGLVFTVYTSVNNGTSTYLYAIADAVTGQNIVQPSTIPVVPGGAISGSSRAFIVGNYFVIVSQVTVTAVKYLQYCSIPISNPVNTTTNLPNISGAQNVNSDVYSGLTSNPGWDGVVTNNTLVLAYNTTTGAQGIHVTTLTQQQIALNVQTSIIKTFPNAAYIGNLVSVCLDSTVSPNIVYVSFWNAATNNGYTCAAYIGFGSITTQFTPQQIISSVTISNLASAAQNNVCTVFSEVVNAYSYDSSVPSHFIDAVTVSSAGSVGTPYVAIRSVGLASKAFIVSGKIYFLAAYNSPFQPTYFLIDGATTAASPLVIAKLAYENGGGYLVLGLPSVNVSGSVATVSYLFKDLVEALNTLGNTQQTTAGGIYSQTGINMVSFTIGTTKIGSTEIGNNLNLGGGFGWMYDGYLPVEQNFFTWPDSVELTGSASGGTMTAQQYYYQVIRSWSDNQGNIFRSAPSIPVTVTTTGGTSSVTVNVPTDRLTYKTANPSKIEIYRWSTANQVYYQVTSITAPQLNSTTSDSIAFVDTLPDTSIVGNEILYTTGGVVENVNPPAYSVTTLFDTRQWFISSEDRNVLGFTKQIVQGAPVEFSDLFTRFIAPNSGASSSTGPMTAIFPMDDKLIIFKKNAIYYINGAGPDNTGANSGYSEPIFITSTVGCENQNSIVFMPAGLLFQSGQGIWLLGRDLSTVYIGAPVEDFNDSTVESALNVPQTTEVRFTLDTGQHLLYDYYYNQWGTFVGVPAISSCVYQNKHSFLNSYGKIFQENPGSYLDGSNPVLMSFVTGHIQLQGISGYQRVFEIQLLGEYLSPHLLNFQIGYNFEALSEQVLITPTNYTGVFGSDSIYGMTSPYGGPGSLEQWRIQPSTQKCQAFQISLQEVYDGSLGQDAGAGFTLSAMTCVLGLNRSYRPVKATNTVGTSN